MRKFKRLTILVLAVISISMISMPILPLTGCQSIGLPTGNAKQLKAFILVGLQIAQVVGKISPEQAQQVMDIFNTIPDDGTLDLQTFLKAGLSTAIASGKLTPEQAAQIQSIIDLLSANQKTLAMKVR